MKKLLLCLLLLSVLLPCASAHGDKTDADGGHYDTQTGEYHYHHGYSAHQHPDGVCPYGSAVQTNTSYQTKKQVDEDEWIEPTESSFQYHHNEGYLTFISEMIDSEEYQPYEYMLIDMANENTLRGDTPLEETGYDAEEAFNMGYDSAQDDFQNILYQVEEIEHDDEQNYEDLEYEFEEYRSTCTQTEDDVEKAYQNGLKEGELRNSESERDIMNLLFWIPTVIAAYFYEKYRKEKKKNS